MKKLNSVFKSFSSKNKGFTLIEILVVIGIIAVLAAIVIVAINPAKQFAQARNTQRTSNVESILNAVGQRMADNKGVFEGSFDANLYDCDELPTSITNITSNNGTGALSDPVAGSGDLGCLVPTYISVLPTEPVSGGLVYTIELLANGRVQICAPEAANENAIPDSATICLTR